MKYNDGTHVPSLVQAVLDPLAARTTGVGSRCRQSSVQDAESGDMSVDHPAAADEVESAYLHHHLQLQRTLWLPAKQRHVQSSPFHTTRIK